MKVVHYVCDSCYKDSEDENGFRKIYAEYDGNLRTALLCLNCLGDFENVMGKMHFSHEWDRKEYDKKTQNHLP